MSNESFNEKGVELLRIAIVKQACWDYRRALICLHNSKNEKRSASYKHDAYRIEKFFKSDWCYLLTGLDGDFLIDSIKQEVIDFDYNMKKLRTYHAKYNPVEK